MKKSDLWRELVEEAGEDAIERAANVSVEQAEADLAAAGFDVAAERAKAEAFLVALETGTLDAAPRPTAAVVPRTPPRQAHPEDRWRPPPTLLLIGVAAAAAVAGAFLYAATHRAPEQIAPLPPSTSSPPVVPSTPPEQRVLAADLRGRAAGDCDAQLWSDCLAHLDQAQAADPAGDDAPAVKELRGKAIGGILKKPKAPPP